MSMQKRNRHSVKPVVPDGVRDGGGQVCDTAPTATGTEAQPDAAACHCVDGPGVSLRDHWCGGCGGWTGLAPWPPVEVKRRNRPPRIKVSHKNPRTTKPLRPTKRDNKVRG